MGYEDIELAKFEKAVENALFRLRIARWADSMGISPRTILRRHCSPERKEQYRKDAITGKKDLFDALRFAMSFIRAVR